MFNYTYGSLFLIAVVLICHCRCNMPPESTTDQYLFTFENATMDTVLFQLKAKDEDLGDSLKFEYVSGLDADENDLLELGQPRRINRSTNEWACDIILKGVLDRDNRRPYRNLFYQVTDSKSNWVPIRFPMVLDDVNDNPPMFIGLPYQTSVSENTSPSRTIFHVTATDPDNGRSAKVVYSMEAKNDVNEADYSSTFKLDPSSGAITLKKSLDYRTQSFYHFKVSSHDEGDPQCPGPLCYCNQTHLCVGKSVDLFITVIDEQNSPPVFEKLPYYESVNESVPLDFFVIQAFAVDGDRGVSRPNNISFSLSSDSSIPFQIDETNGVITVAEELNADDPAVRSRGGLYIFFVTATEKTDGRLTNASTTTQVTVTVTDTNDNEPKFEKSDYDATVVENTPRGVPLSMTSTIGVSDDDQGINSRFQLFLENSKGERELNFETIPSQNQTVQGNTTVTIIVNNSTLLDYETVQHLQIKLVAKEVTTNGDAPRSSIASINITIKDANDHSPQFLTNQTTFNVSEGASIDDTITTIHAKDPDSGQFGRVVYSLEDTSADAAFKIDENGKLSVASSLNREKLDMYSLMVVAMDSPGEPEDQRRRSLLRLSIRVTDINDNDPEWPKAFPSFSVSEIEKHGQNIGFLRASDDDIGRNGEIEYSIEANDVKVSLFGVNKTSTGWANLYVNQNLTGYSGSQNITLIATDKGQIPRSSNVSLSVVIVDVNLHSPQFVEPRGNLTIDEELPIGSSVTSFSAIDLDLGDNGKVQYYLSSYKDNDFFSIDRRTGLLTVAARLDGDTKQYYEISVQAKDNGQPKSLSTTMKLFVFLTDKDDNGPSYGAIDRSKPYGMSVEEENPNAVIGKVLTAQDKDSNPENRIVCYYIYGGENIDSLSLDKRTGLLSLRQKLDREKSRQFDIVIKASANCNESIIPINVKQNVGISLPSIYNQSDQSLLWIRITVSDTNDHRPIFTQQEFSAGIIYDANIGSLVLSLMGSVSDEDSPENSEHLFRLKEYTPSPEMADSLDTNIRAFDVSKIGNITTAIRFRSDMSGFFLLKIEVYDRDRNDLNDTTQVKIYIISNLQRVKLVFSKQPNEVERIKDDLFRELAEILGFQIIADKIVTHRNLDGKTDPKKTDVFIHGRYEDTGEVVSASRLWRAFDFNPSASSLLTRNGVLKAEDLTQKEDDSEDGNERIFAIAVSVLAIMLVAVSMVFVNMMRIYRRRLKAATTIAFASPKEQEMYEHPGTNKYYAAANPLFGKEIKSTELEEDKLSTNSLDINAVDRFSKSNAGTEEEQEVVLQISDSALSTPQHNKSGHLDKVLQEYETAMKANDFGQDKTSPTHIPLKNIKAISGRRSTMVIPGLGTEIQEGVTRFSDESLSGDSGFPDGENGISTSKGYLEYSDI